jgi:hypothetical protein
VEELVYLRGQNSFYLTFTKLNGNVLLYGNQLPVDVLSLVFVLYCVRIKGITIMMKDEEKTKGQLIKELAELRGIIAECEVSKAKLSEQDQNHKLELYTTIQKKLPT